MKRKGDEDIKGAGFHDLMVDVDNDAIFSDDKQVLSHLQSSSRCCTSSGEYMSSASLTVRMWLGERAIECLVPEQSLVQG